MVSVLPGDVTGAHDSGTKDYTKQVTARYILDYPYPVPLHMLRELHLQRILHDDTVLDEVIRLDKAKEHDKQYVWRALTELCRPQPYVEWLCCHGFNISESAAIKFMEYDIWDNFYLLNCMYEGGVTFIPDAPALVEKTGRVDILKWMLALKQ